MREQTVMWTALPNGVAVVGGLTVLKLSVFASVRLKTNEGKTLDKFPDFVNWPETLFPPSGDPRPAAQFFVQFAGSTTLIGANRLGALPRSDLWTALFTNATPLRLYKFKDLSAKQIYSFPSQHVSSFLNQEYANTATALSAESDAIPRPKAEDLLASGRLGQIAFLKVPDVQGPDESLLAQALNAQLKSKGLITSASLPNPTTDFLQLKRFHKQPNVARTPKETLRAAQKSWIKKFDFHQMLGALGEYGGTPDQPGLLRLLGLVHDLQIPFPGELGSTGVQVVVTWTPRVADSATFQTIKVPNFPPDLPLRKLMTKCSVSATAFTPAPRPGSMLSDGMLDLSRTDAFQVAQIDVDSAGLKMLDFANYVKRSFHVRRTADTPLEHSFPTLRSAGLSVARIGRAQLVQSASAVHSQLNTNLEGQLDNELYADDVIRGYRVDVWDAKLGWKSLCRRVGTYSIPSAQSPLHQLTVEDEGLVSTAVTKALDSASKQLYLQDTLFRWAGWSLVVSRPGNTISPEDPADTTQAPVMRKENKPPTTLNPHLKLEAAFTVPPGSLPRLRYGVEYRLRARAVDLAGNSPPFTRTGFTTASPATTYARFEPVPSPVLVKRHPNTKGESLERMVIRSNYDTGAAATVPSQRHIAPPKVSQLMAEQHGLFDVANPSSPTQTILNPAAYALVVQKDTGDFLTGGAIDPNDYKLDPNDPQNTGQSQKYFDVDPPLPLPYLPDPFSNSVAFHSPPPSTPTTVETHRGLPGVAGQVYGPPGATFYRSGATWPNPKPLLLKIEEGPDPPSAPDWNPTTGILRVVLPKAWVARVRYSSFPDGEDLAKMGLWLWMLAAGLSPTAQTHLRDRGSRGLHWMLTPFRELLLVHAVRQPLKAPLWSTQFRAERTLGQTFATIIDEMFEVDGKSTSKITVKADWQEPMDVPSESTWKLVAAKAEPFEAPVTQTDTQIALTGKHEFGDTKYRQVTYRFVASTRFREYFELPTQSKDVALSGTTAPVLDDHGVAEGSEVVKKLDLSQQYVRDKDYSMNYRLGKIARISGGAIADGQTVHVEFGLSTVRESAAAIVRNVPNSARPAAPKVLYVVPTFGWTVTPRETTTASKIQSTRRGKGLRVYLERPWWSSGDGELLGVVLWPGPSVVTGVPVVPDKLKPYVTQWGMDPVWKSGTMTALPTLGAFKLAAATKTGLSLDEVANEPVSVAGHKVGYDDVRQLWYCDVEIDAGASAYFPFVRLALARYQPISVADTELSRVVLADFAQLAPDRVATITFDAKKPTSVAVTLAGLSYKASAAGTGPSGVQVEVEERILGVEGDLGWTRAAGGGASLAPQQGSGGTTQWVGQVTLPAARGTRPFRLVIKEFERFRVTASSTTQRLVYADAVEI